MSPELFESIIQHLRNTGVIQGGEASAVNLYNWGEPFLNPGFNAILAILKRHGLRAGISSNFIVEPVVDNDMLPVISNVIFSLSGFSQESYSRIHGGSLDKVLGNFERFYRRIRDNAPDARIDIAWHRYTFNEHELWKAYDYFARMQVNFVPSVAYFNDLTEMLQYAAGKLSEDRLRQAGKDLFLDHISSKLAYHGKRSRQYRCFMWNYLVIDEFGQLLLCCGSTNRDSGHVLGNILEMNAEEIRNRKMSHPLCSACISSGLPRSSVSMGDMPLPPGGGRRRYKLWRRLKLSNGLFCYVSTGLVRILEDLPGGEKLLRGIRRIRK